MAPEYPHVTYIRPFAMHALIGGDAIWHLFVLCIRRGHAQPPRKLLRGPNHKREPINRISKVDQRALYSAACCLASPIAMARYACAIRVLIRIVFEGAKIVL